MRRKLTAAVAGSVFFLAACGDIVDWIAGSYQPQDRNGAGPEPYLILQAAPDSVQATSVDVGTLVYVQAAGGDRLGVRATNGAFTVFQLDGGAGLACLPVPPNLTVLAVKPQQQSQALLLVDLLARDEPEGGADVGAASDEAGEDGGDAATTMSNPEPDGDEPACGPGYHVVLSAAAIISDMRVVVLDGGAPDATPGDAVAMDASADAIGGDGPPLEDGSSGLDGAATEGGDASDASD